MAGNPTITSNIAPKVDYTTSIKARICCLVDAGRECQVQTTKTQLEEWVEGTGSASSQASEADWVQR
jgi:hypothetical protein